MGEIDQVPARKIPVAAAFRFVLEADNQMHGVVAHFVRRDLRLEVERPEAAVPAADSVEFRSR